MGRQLQHTSPDISSNTAPHQPRWENGPIVWLAVALAAALLAYLFQQPRSFLLYMWLEKEEYSHALFIPVVSLFLVWQRKNQLATLSFIASWGGVAIFAAGAFMFLAGQLGALAMLMDYAMVVMLYGLALSLLGRPAFRLMLVPILMLAFMIPLPGFLYETLSSRLQLLSSQIGVAVIRLLDISVYLEGNVIDLGGIKLQVAEACNGLRYLFPLTTLGFIAAYFYTVETWKRVIVFLSSVPITVLMNSARIGIIGIMVEYWGRSMAEGFLHDFEGWAVFMTCTALLVVEMKLLTFVGTDRRPLHEVFGINLPERLPRDPAARRRTLPVSFLASLALLAATAGMSASLVNRPIMTPARTEFVTFPRTLGEWRGIDTPLEQIYIDTLRMDDYLYADYAKGSTERINLFMSYYASQEADRVPHSPRACLPGGGWQFVRLETSTLHDVVLNGAPLRVNRAITQKDNARNLIYYWFQQRGRNIAGEYETKWYLFWDSLTRHRSDGALIRIITPIAMGEDEAHADQRLKNFLQQLLPQLPEYVPN